MFLSLEMCWNGVSKLAEDAGLRLWSTSLCVRWSASKQQAWGNIASAVQRVESTHLANCVSGAQRVGGRCFCVIIPTSLLGLKRSHKAVINNRSLC